MQVTCPTQRCPITMWGKLPRLNLSNSEHIENNFLISLGLSQCSVEDPTKSTVRSGIADVTEWQLSSCQSGLWQQPGLTLISLLGLLGGMLYKPNFLLVGKLSTKVFFTAFAVLGLFTCFFGHRFWKTGTEYFILPHKSCWSFINVTLCKLEWWCYYQDSLAGDAVSSRSTAFLLETLSL